MEKKSEDVEENLFPIYWHSNEHTWYINSQKFPVTSKSFCLPCIIQGKGFNVYKGCVLSIWCKIIHAYLYIYENSLKLLQSLFETFPAGGKICLKLKFYTKEICISNL